MQLIEIYRVKENDKTFSFRLDLAYSNGRRRTGTIILDAPKFSEFTWNLQTERFPTTEGGEMGAVANKDFDRIERWIEDVFDEFSTEGDIHVDDLMKRLLMMVAEKEIAFRTKFVGTFRMFRRLTFVNGIARQRVSDDETLNDIYIAFPPIHPYPFENDGINEKLSF